MRWSLQNGTVFLALLVGVSYHSPAQSPDAQAGSRIFSTNCAGCHGSDGRGGERAPNIATARNVSGLKDADLVNFVHNGIPGAGMPSFSFLGDRGISDVVAYLRVLQGKTENVEVTGDAEAGHALFFGSAGCSKCHMVHGEGGFIASDLTDYGNGTPPDQIRTAIVEPEKVVGRRSEVVEVRSSGGDSVRGVVRAEDNFTLVLQTEDGQYRRFKKDRLAEVHRTGQSLMPRDYKDRLSPKELDDLVGYLIRAATSIEPKPARKRRGGGQ
ncbi:c-type cytochrome [Edaphobacter sp. HDX4]|uniref:c-type cytochrome n=1 Tax=Edaphobacter sp. HDX4 TaxID=2794064 RepID=UPI002FE5BAEA